MMMVYVLDVGLVAVTVGELCLTMKRVMIL
jgi:hypothetical protein